MNKLAIRKDDLAQNPAARIAVGICLDVSPSMEGDPIAELNEGVKLFYEQVKQDEVARHSVEAAVVAFSGMAYRIRDFGPILEDTAPDLAVDMISGGTSLGSGVAMTLDLLERRKAEYKAAGVEYFQPWLVLVTDGQPTDDTHLAVVPRIVRLVESKKLSVFAIGVGPGADLRTLSTLSPARPPLRLDGLNFREFFKWLSASVKCVSSERPGDTVSLPAEGIASWAEI